ncbi:hypothetical protein [Frigoribacterium sp. RIT-PI-h]|uniref:hypothetical protein n=1 Tax=Frigoribacterium sp. RIT-PI-h TaxID=1690245 RepID=UPI0006BA0BC7|nr:hypothetical protein [Frigoribacterium sp. RIT-PI-h]KPG78895.1 hypothetical protein AEQ27_14410 [Frigoribacterium sp. RIT-PI-h]
MAKDITPDGRDDRRDENTPSQDDAWSERLRREDEDQDARATTELPTAAPGQPTAPTTPIVADDQRTRELPADGSAFRTASAAETAGTTSSRRPTKRLLVGIGIAAAGLALVGTSTAVAVSNAGSSTSASSTATPGQDDAASQGDGSRQEPGGRGSDDGATGAPTDAPTPPAAGDDSDGSTPAEGTGPDGKALPTPGTGPDGDALPTPGDGSGGKALPDAPEGGPAAGGPKPGPAAGGPKGGPGHDPRHEDAAAPDDAKGDDATKPMPTPPADAPTPSDSPDAESGTGS